MAHNLTESEAYTANVSIPDDGDARNAASVESAYQALANRTKYLKAKVDPMLMHARFGISAVSPGVASGSKLTLAALDLPINSGDFTLSSNEIVVPAAGVYLVAALLRMACSAATEPLTITANITAGTSPDTWKSNQLQLSMNRVTNGHPEYASVTGLIKITNPATEKISIVSGNSNIIVDPTLVESHRTISIVRLT